MDEATYGRHSVACDRWTPELTNVADYSLSAYEPSQVLPIVFACIITVSLAVHVWQNL